MAEAQFRLRCVTSNVDKYCHLLLALPKASYRLVSHLVTQVPKDDSYENVKAVLLSHHVLSDYQRVELMSKMEPMGARKPSDLLAAMMEQVAAETRMDDERSRSIQPSPTTQNFHTAASATVARPSTTPGAAADLHRAIAAAVPDPGAE
jgi:hypothetical protein